MGCRKVPYQLFNTRKRAHGGGMAEVKYYNRGGRIVLICRSIRPVFVYHTGEKVAPAHWDAVRKRAKKQAPGSVDINEGLDVLGAFVLEQIRQARNSGKTLYGYELRRMVDARWKRKAEPGQASDLIAFAGQLLRERRKNPDYAKGTCDTYSTTISLLKRYARQRGGTIPFDRVDMQFHADLVAWMYAQGLCANYMHVVFSRLKTFLYAAEERGLGTTATHRAKAFSVKCTETHPLALREEEVQRIEGLHLSGEMAYVRDAFLLQCYTGLRFSDVRKLPLAKKEQYGTGVVVPVAVQKGRKTLYVRVCDRTQRILEGYPAGIPPVKNKDSNRLLKQIAAVAHCPAGISTHTGRRTFATLGYLAAVKAGRSLAPLVRAMGHTNEQMFLRYVRLSGGEAAVLVA